MSQCPCKVQDSIHKTIWGPKFYTCPSGAQNFTQGLGCQLIFEISKFFYTEFVLNVFSVPRWVFLANGIKMTLKVPGAILARFENSDPLCGPTMENARIFNTHHGSKRPIMDPPNHAVMVLDFSPKEFDHVPRNPNLKWIWTGGVGSKFRKSSYSKSIC